MNARLRHWWTLGEFAVRQRVSLNQLEDGVAEQMLVLAVVVAPTPSRQGRRGDA